MILVSYIYFYIARIINSNESHIVTTYFHAQGLHWKVDSTSNLDYNWRLSEIIFSIFIPENTYRIDYLVKYAFPHWATFPQ